MSLQPCHIELAQANAFVERLHRHHGRIQGHRFSIGAVKGGELVGVIVVGRPVGGQHQNDWTDGTKNTCSFLYAAAARASAELGFLRIQTYVLDSETGISLRAAGWSYERLSHPVGWHRDGPRAARTVDPWLMKRKQLWFKIISRNLPFMVEKPEPRVSIPTLFGEDWA
jgi:hypothetical protein